MKNFVKIFSVLVLVTVLFSFTKIGERSKADDKPDGLYCSYRDSNGNKYTCWFCDCEAFVKGSRGQQKAQ